MQRSVTAQRDQELTAPAARVLTTVVGAALAVAALALLLTGWMFSGSVLSTATGRSRVLVTLLLAGVAGAVTASVLPRRYTDRL